jgi:RNA polymerase sigma-70 factor (ECF subfamily)
LSQAARHRPAPEAQRAVNKLAASSAERGFRIAVDLLGNRAEAEEAVQEALARACESIDRLRDRAALRGWYFRVLTNICMRILRRRRMRRAVWGWWREPESPIAGMETRALMAGLETLPAKQKAALLLRYGHDLSVAEVAEMLGVTPETAKTHLARGLRKLRDHFGVRP